MDAKTMVKPRGRKWAKLNKKIASFYFIMHLLCILAPFHFNWGAFFVFLALYTITCLFGITISYHRNLTHKSFTLPKCLEYVFAYCGVHSLQADPISWVSTHRYHHQFADTERDPHSPIEGLWFSHIAWIFYSDYFVQKVCQEVSVGKQWKPNNVGDLEKQFFYRFMHKTYLLHPIALAILLYAAGGIPYLIWGMCIRIVVLFHVTYMVNSISHTWGRQPWKNGDLSRNNWWLSLLSFGEGWHNNHHAFDYSAKLGLEWWQIDIGWYVIMLLRAVGLVTNVKVPSESHKKRRAMDKPKDLVK